jgi:hypothetical protein
MRFRTNNAAGQILLLILCTLGTLALADGTPQTLQPKEASTVQQQSFSSPEEAAEALIQAAESYDVPALLRVLGPDGHDLVVSQDPVEDKNNAAAFVALARQETAITVDPENAHIAALSVGSDDWPLPIPIVQEKGGWFFDSKQGREEILLRRIGNNELDAIQVCRGFVEAQHEYAAVRHDGSHLNQYAQRIISTPGKHDGLAWQNPDGTWGGPVGEAVARALAEGYTASGPPYHGYYFKVLKGQGPDARLGEMNYIVDGAMIGGFALLAAPAQYRVTGVKTFMVGYDGALYENDLGPTTLSIFQRTEQYNPDKAWTLTDDNW